MTRPRQTDPVFLDALAGPSGTQDPTERTTITRSFPDATALTSVVRKGNSRANGTYPPYQPPVFRLPPIQLSPGRLLPGQLPPDLQTPAQTRRPPTPAPLPAPSRSGAAQPQLAGPPAGPAMPGYGPPPGYGAPPSYGPPPVQPLAPGQTVQLPPGLEWLTAAYNQSIAAAGGQTAAPGRLAPPGQFRSAPRARQQSSHVPTPPVVDPSSALRSQNPKKGSAMLGLLFAIVVVLAFTNLGDQVMDWLRSLLDSISK